MDHEADKRHEIEGRQPPPWTPPVSRLERGKGQHYIRGRTQWQENDERKAFDRGMQYQGSPIGSEGRPQQRATVFFSGDSDSDESYKHPARRYAENRGARPLNTSHARDLADDHLMSRFLGGDGNLKGEKFLQLELWDIYDERRAEREA